MLSVCRNEPGSSKYGNRAQTVSLVKLSRENWAGLHLHIDELEARHGQYYLDALLTVAGSQEPLAAEVKRWAAQANLGALINQVQALPLKGVLVADHINPNMAEKLRAQRVQFIDTAGNAYIDLPPIYVLVMGKRMLNQQAGTKVDSNRAFDRTGLKVVFALLCQPELVAAPYREIAEVAGVALGTVGWVINGLKATRFIVEYGKRGGRELVNCKRLLDRWVESYPEKLRPKIYLGDYYAENPDWWKAFDLPAYNGYWGGEIAAAHYTQYLQPAVTTLYLAKETKRKFLAQARLRAAPERRIEQAGSVRLYQTFWQDTVLNATDIAKPGLVPPVLAYADLIATADPRNIEAAGVIYDPRNRSWLTKVQASYWRT